MRIEKAAINNLKNASGRQMNVPLTIALDIAVKIGIHP